MIVESAPFKSAYAFPGMVFDPVTEIELMVSRIFQLSKEEIRERTRLHGVVKPRQIAIYFIRKYTALPYEAIGERFGIDHTTALYSYRQVKTLIEVRDKQYIPAIEQLEGEIKEHPAFVKIDE